MLSRPWETLLNEQRDGYTVIVDKSYEECHPSDLFDTSINPDTNKPYYDVEQMCRDIDAGRLDWFILRARVFYSGVELGSDIVGGFLYEDAREVLKDGTAEDLIYSAMEEARKKIVELADAFSIKALQISVDNTVH